MAQASPFQVSSCPPPIAHNPRGTGVAGNPSPLAPGCVDSPETREEGRGQSAGCLCPTEGDQAGDTGSRGRL